MNQGGFVSKEALESITEKLKERPSFWLLEGEIAHCCSWELETYKKIKDSKK